jgi:hypothetical protein
MLIQGGISINTTSFATDKSNGGGLTVAGGVGISKNLIVGGDVTFVSTTQSYDNTNGALVVIGGVGINGNLNVAGNTILQGNLIVNGTTTSLVSTNTELTDNIFMLNAGPTGTKDSGFVINRWQYNNDDGEGDVVSDALYTQDTLQSPQGSLNANEVRLSTNASSSDDYYNGWWIKMISGANATPNPQVRKIIDYDGTSKIATLSADWTSSNPAGNDTYRLYNKPYIGLVYNEDDDIFEFGATVEDPSQTISSLIFTESMPIRFSYAQSLTSTASTNASSGALLMAGGISINNTTNASSATNGGTFTTLGGGGIAKSLYVGESLYVSSVNMTPNPGDIITSVTSSGVNNQSSFASITGMSFSNTIWGFDVYMTTHIQRTEGNLYTNYHLRGVNKITSWELIKSYVGDDSGLEFDINTSGQIRYTSPDYGLSFTDLTFKWRTFTN